MITHTTVQALSQARLPRPDVVVYRADTIDVSPTRPEHVLLVAEGEVFTGLIRATVPFQVEIDLSGAW